MIRLPANGCQLSSNGVLLETEEVSLRRLSSEEEEEEEEGVN